MDESDRPKDAPECGQNKCEECTGEAPPPKRKRGLTSVTLQWLADKFKRAQEIKDQLAQGTYQVDTQKVAKAIVNGDNKR